MTARLPSVAATLAGLTPAQVRAIQLLGYPAWTDRELLRGLCGPTLRVLERLRLAEWKTIDRVPPVVRCGITVSWVHLWRLTQRGLRVKGALGR